MLLNAHVPSMGLAGWVTLLVRCAVGSTARARALMWHRALLWLRSEVKNMSFVRALRDETCSTMTTTPTSLTCASILTRHPSISPLGFSGLTANPLSSSGSSSSSSREANNGKGLPSSGVAKPKQAVSKQLPSALTFPFDPVPHIRNGPCFVQGVNVIGRWRYDDGKKAILMCCV